jgi:hypothetical protein
MARDALQAALLDNEISYVATIQFFHNHPLEGGALSEGDLMNQKFIHNYFQNEGNPVPVHIYAVTMRGDKRIIFHNAPLN